MGDFFTAEFTEKIKHRVIQRLLSLCNSVKIFVRFVVN